MSWLSQLIVAAVLHYAAGLDVLAMHMNHWFASIRMPSLSHVLVMAHHASTNVSDC
jgi:hypothetical protein